MEYISNEPFGYANAAVNGIAQIYINENAASGEQIAERLFGVHG